MNPSLKSVSSPLFGDDALAPRPREIRPGAVHIPGYLTPEQQAWTVRAYAEWRSGPVPAHRALIGGKPMSVESLGLGWHWRQGGYTPSAPEFDGARPLPLPDWLARLAARAVADAQLLTEADLTPDGPFEPDVALANYYAPGARMGMHQDADERRRAPVVSLSLGDSCVFRLGNTEHRNRPYEDVRLASGDLFVFGGPCRFAFHGVPSVLDGTGPRGIGLSADDGGPGGRINITLRETGLG
ncbi:alpha-ketoglutarate-dependent dioxygenase AlkB [Arthrobacter sp. UM1]|nr:alpha-ketoglutarate-dependent dioxygenase AlkB [Arthrobacter sp. UM1]